MHGRQGREDCKRIQAARCTAAHASRGRMSSGRARERPERSSPRLGAIGKCAGFDGYALTKGVALVGSASIPFVVEAWAKDATSTNGTLLVNRTPTTGSSPADHGTSTSTSVDADLRRPRSLADFVTTRSRSTSRARSCRSRATGRPPIFRRSAMRRSRRCASPSLARRCSFRRWRSCHRSGRRSRARYFTASTPRSGT